MSDLKKDLYQEVATKVNKLIDSLKGIPYVIKANTENNTFIGYFNKNNKDIGYGEVEFGINKADDIALLKSASFMEFFNSLSIEDVNTILVMDGRIEITIPNRQDQSNVVEGYAYRSRTTLRWIFRNRRDMIDHLCTYSNIYDVLYRTVTIGYVRYLKNSTNTNKKILYFNNINLGKFSNDHLENNVLSKYKNNILGYNINSRIKILCFVKIKDYKVSSEIFGYSKLKKNMYESGQYFKIENILLDHTCKKDSIVRNIIEIKLNNRNYKFDIEDIEFILPSFDNIVKGYNKPKDRVIKPGVRVKVIDNRKTRFNKNEILTVDSVQTLNKGKVYATVKGDDKKGIINSKKIKVI